MIFTLVTAMIWVGVSLFRSQQRTGIPIELQNLAKPLNPNINTQVIERIEKKRGYSPSELANFPVYRLIRLKNGQDVVSTELPQEDEEPSAVITAGQEIQASESASVVNQTQSASNSATQPPTATSSATTP